MSIKAVEVVLSNRSGGARSKGEKTGGEAEKKGIEIDDMMTRRCPRGFSWARGTVQVSRRLQI
jgi:hypothetical protein